MRAFLRRHAVASYYVLTFAISWGGIVLILGPTNLLAPEDVFASMRWVPPLVLGPAVSGIVMTAVVGGRQGLRDYLARLVRWRVRPRWYVIALLTAPLYYLATTLLLATVSRDFLPALLTTSDRGALVIQAVIAGLAAGIFEELGWTGFAIPMLRRRHGTFATALVVGTLWGVWHIVPKLVGERAYEMVPYIAIDMLTAIVALTGYRILMVWVYDRTQSLLIAILMHAALTGGMMLLSPAVVGAQFATFIVVLAAAPWLIIAAVELRRHARDGWSPPVAPAPPSPR